MFNLLKEKLIVFSWRRILAGLGIFLLLVLLGFAGLTVCAQGYRGRVLPGVHIGSVPVGGLNQTELKNLLQTFDDKLNAQGVEISFVSGVVSHPAVIFPSLVSADTAKDLISLDTKSEAERLLRFGREEGIFSELINSVSFSWTQPVFTLNVFQVDRPGLKEELQKKGMEFETLPRSASIVVDTLSPLQYHLVSSTVGFVFHYDTAVEEIVSAWSKLSLPQIVLTAETKTPEVTEADVRNLENRLDKVISAGPMTLVYTEPQTNREFNWTLSNSDLANNLVVQKNGEDLVFGLDHEYIFNFLTNKVVLSVNVEAKNARFSPGADGKVSEFEASRPGVKLDQEQTYQAINNAFAERTLHDEGFTKSVSLVVEKVEPEVKTGAVNDLGISEILGVGVSSYVGSSYNRLLNIKNAAKKLNGLLIKPGETFSTISGTSPITAAGGYVPEMAILGDEIKAEIGGGLCQIATTLFRMGMNSGMPITERRPHALSVSYYFDPVNHLPGTDATVYEPHPDLRFLNDTGNYLLIQTEVDPIKKELIFTLWGKSDGRQGSYSHPRLIRWIPYGATVEKISADLKPGERKCQKPFRGADTEFTYTRILADGTKDEIIYENHYRPLPEICLSGAEVKPVEGEMTASSTAVVVE